MKLKITDIIKKKEEIQKSFKEIEIPVLGGSLEIKKMALSEFLEMLDDFSEKTTTAEAVKMQVEIIYECIPLLHSSEIQEAFECAEPTDVVYKILNDDLSEIARIFNEILDFYGMASDDLKNL